MLNNFMKNENDENEKNVDQTMFNKSTESENSNKSEKESTTVLLKNLKRNAHIERSSSKFQNSIDENLENVDLININESRKVKNKNRPKNSKNEKLFMTRVEKRIVKSIRRDSFEFEYLLKTVHLKTASLKIANEIEVELIEKIEKAKKREKKAKVEEVKEVEKAEKIEKIERLSS
ncbi:MAG: hypothetical protein Q9195_009378, partial [Heterodermia aff. obscurata]